MQRNRILRYWSLGLILIAFAFSINRGVAQDATPQTNVTRSLQSDLLIEKTFVVWAAPDDLWQKGAGVFSIADTIRSNRAGILYAGDQWHVWAPNTHLKYRRASGRKENAGPDELVQIVVSYQGKKVVVYRNGEIYAKYDAPEETSTYSDASAILIGPSSFYPVIQNYAFTGKIRDARIYPKALSQETIAAMKPGEPIPNETPYAWWDFATTGIEEKTGRFGQVKIYGDTKVQDGCLVLKGVYAALIAYQGDQPVGTHAPHVPIYTSPDEPVSPSALTAARHLRDRLVVDPWRPEYHFVLHSGLLNGDVNGCFYANGRYHMMYMYPRAGAGFSWGHSSSKDLLHWRNHPDPINPGQGDTGCFSGGGFVDDDGTAYIMYWMLTGPKGIGMAKSTDRHFSRWTKFPENPVIKSTSFGITKTKDADGNDFYYASADPTNIWKKGDQYYVACGNGVLVDKIGKKGHDKNVPQIYQGDHISLFKSTDLKNWAYVHDFYDRRTDNSWTAADEDNMCPNFLPLPASSDGRVKSDKHLLIFISHNRGTQYYLGTYDKENDKFLPETHGRMSWVDISYFAPEALLGPNGRQIMWAWILCHGPEMFESGDNGWRFCLGLPRSLWVGDDNTLRMAPIEELKTLRYNDQSWSDISLASGASRTLDVVAPRTCDLEITMAADFTAKQVGLRVLTSPDGEETTRVYYDAVEKKLCMDARKSGAKGQRSLALEQAPFELKDGEELTLRILIDKSVVEIYANERQAIARRVFPTREDSVEIILEAQGGSATFPSVKSWEMMPSNPY